MTNLALDYKNKQPLAVDVQTDKSVNELQLVRRLDWRFLLPNPSLTSVAYIGQNNQTLLSALQYFCETVYFVNETAHFKENHKRQSRFDSVVVTSLNFSDIEKACTLLKDGGYLYWEIERTGWINSLNKKKKSQQSVNSSNNGVIKGFKDFGNLHKHIAFLKKLGFTDIEINWHRPNFDKCLEIIPLNNPTALDYYFSRDRTDLAGQFKIVAGRLMMKSGILKYVVPCVSVVACKRLN